MVYPGGMVSSLQKPVPSLGNSRSQPKRMHVARLGGRRGSLRAALTPALPSSPVQSLTLRGKVKQGGQLNLTQHLGNVTDITAATAPADCSSPPSCSRLTKRCSAEWVCKLFHPAPWREAWWEGLVAFLHAIPAPSQTAD